jgi:hypothetical protein
MAKHITKLKHAKPMFKTEKARGSRWAQVDDGDGQLWS